ncbi:hypothetical protein [Absidia glauca]|uniref:Uncharacterized protein n=1 Tax=Absidia glauca TaxID=4829 RepID=A0A163KVC1_ABSGL|nr:hypothetical protein [Absidia glauca]
MVDNILAMAHIKRELHPTVVTSSKRPQVYTKGYIHDPLRPIAIGKLVQQCDPVVYRSYHEDEEKSEGEGTLDRADSGETSSMDDGEEEKKSTIQGATLNFPEVWSLKCNTTCGTKNRTSFKGVKLSWYHSIDRNHLWVYVKFDVHQRLEVGTDRRKRGRHLWVAKDFYKGPVAKPKKALKKHLYSNVMTTIGYARKKVFASCSANADSDLLSRDLVPKVAAEELVTGSNGNMDDLRCRLDKKLANVRLVVLDYAGLSTDCEDIQRFLRKYQQVDGFKPSSKDEKKDHHVFWDGRIIGQHAQDIHCGGTSSLSPVFVPLSFSTMLYYVVGKNKFE